MATIVIRKLTQWNRHKFFNQPFYHMEPCTYDPGYFLFSCVAKLADKARVEIKYISKTEDKHLYRMTSSYGFWVVGCIGENLEHINEDKTYLFDPQQLVC